MALTLFDRLQHWITEPPPDHLFEITETSIAAVSPRSPGQHKQEILSERGLLPSPAAPNLLKTQLYRDALAKFTPLSALKRRAAALVIPDYAARMAILDFEEFPAGEEERTALLRFRLRKTVPFHIDEAQLSYGIQVTEPKRVEVLAVAIARPILDEYESIFTDAGYRLGLVTPSCLATLRLCGSDNKALTLLAKAAGSNLSVLLLQQDRVRLVRCLDLTGGVNATGIWSALRAGPLKVRSDVTSERRVAGVAGAVRRMNFFPPTTINLASEPFRRERAQNAALAMISVGLTCSLLVLIVLILHERAQAADLRRGIETDRAELQRLQNQESRYSTFVSKPANADVFATSVLLNELIARRGVSWTRVFKDLATVMPTEVRLVGVRLPQVAAEQGTGINRVQLDMIVGTDHPDAVIDLLKRLQKSSLFGPAQVMTQTPPTQNDPLFKYRVTVAYAQKL